MSEDVSMIIQWITHRAVFEDDKQLIKDLIKMLKRKLKEIQNDK